MDERGASEAAVLVAATGVPHLRQERTIIAKLRVGHHAVVHFAIALRELGAVLRTDGTLAGKATVQFRDSQIRLLTSEQVRVVSRPRNPSEDHALITIPPQARLITSPFGTE